MATKAPASRSRTTRRADNLGEGFELYSPFNPLPVSATYTGNTSAGNRTPFCVTALDGTPVDGGGNSFTLVGAPACEVSH